MVVKHRISGQRISKDFILHGIKGFRRCFCLPYNAHRFLMLHLLNVPSLETQFMKRFCKLCNVTVRIILCLLCLNSALISSLISRNLFYISSIFKVKVNDMLNGNVNVIEHDDNDEQVRPLDKQNV